MPLIEQFPRRFLLKLAQQCDPPEKRFPQLELCIAIGSNQIERQPFTDDLRAQAKHIDIIMFNGLMG